VTTIKTILPKILEELIQIHAGKDEILNEKSGT